MVKDKMSFAPGMRIIVRGEEWLIKKVEKNSYDNQAIFCIGISTLVKDREAIFLDDIEDDITITDPKNTTFVKDRSSNFRKSRLFFESQYRSLIPTDGKLHIGHRAAMDCLQFQFVPASESLKQIRHRILIADSVGLGKTLEAGILISELIKRGKGKRILVVALKSMMSQFQKEMWTHFTIPLIRLDSSRIQKIKSELPANYNPFQYYDKTIVSIDTLKQNIEYRTHLENAYWDIIVIDEAQNVAKRGSKHAQRSKLAQLLAKRSDTMIMLSATPHDGRPESFASLINMLDATALSNEKEYSKDDIKGLYVRRFKKDIIDEFQARCPEAVIKEIHAECTPSEEEVFDIFANLKLDMDAKLEANQRKSQGKERLFKTILEKSIFSSPAACIKTIENRIKKLKDKKNYLDEISDINALEELKRALDKVTIKNFSRYQKLLELLNSKEYGWSKDDGGDRIVIFTERIETMKFIAENLKKDLKLKEGQIRTLDGNMKDTEIADVVESFGLSSSSIRVLVASDVASEGLNLHFLSHRIIHFDIPWSLMTFQQRNGRIDRYGQKHQPLIYYLFNECENEKIKGDSRILEILVEKEKQVTQNIGDASLLCDEDGEDNTVYDAIENEDTDGDFLARIMAKFKECQETDDKYVPATLANGDNVDMIDLDTLYDDDIQYLKDTFLQLETKGVRPNEREKIIEIPFKDEIKSRLESLLPKEALPEKEMLRLCADKDKCRDDIQRTMHRENSDDNICWSDFQYLWPLHPIISWANDKNSLIFNRDEAPLVDLRRGLEDNEVIFVISGSIPNRKSTPIVDEFFGLHFKDGNFQEKLTIKEVVSLTRFDEGDIPNPDSLQDKYIDFAKSLVPQVVTKAEEYLDKRYYDYKEKLDKQINDEMDKLGALKEKRIAFIQSNYNLENKIEKEKELANELFNDLVKYVTETLTIENKPYIKIIAGFVGTR